MSNLMIALLSLAGFLIAFFVHALWRYSKKKTN